MEEGTSIRLVSQFLHEHGFKLSLESLQEERCRNLKIETHVILVDTSFVQWQKV